MQIGIGIGVTAIGGFGPVVAAVIDAFDAANKSTLVTLSEGNARMTSSSGDRAVRSVTSQNSGKFYFEVEIVVGSAGAGIGVCNATETMETWVGASDRSTGVDTDAGNVYRTGANLGASGEGAVVAGDVVGVCVDRPAGKIWFRKNGVFGAGQDPVTSTGGFTTPGGGALYVMVSAGVGGSMRLRNFASQFTGVVPSDYSAWSAPDVNALMPLNSRVVYFGDSLTNYGKYDGRKQMTNILAGARYYTNPSFNQGVAGNNTTQMLARINLVTAQIIPGKTLVVFLGGTNDPAASITTATTISNINAIVSQLVAAGAKVLIHTIWKRGVPASSYADESKRTTNNTAIRALTGTAGVTVFDVESVYNPETMSDEAQGLHPNPLGALNVALAEAPMVAAYIDTASILVGQTGNLLINPALTGTAGTLTSGTATGVVADNWRLYRDNSNPNGTVVGSKEVGSDGVERQVVTVTANGTGACYGYFETAAVVTTGGLAGELFEAWVGLELDNSTDLMTTSAAQIIWNGRSMNGCTFGALDHSGVYRTIPTALAADQTTGVRLQFLVIAQANSTTTVKFRSPMARKVPTGQ